MTVPTLPSPYKARIHWVMAIVPFSKQADALFLAKKPIPGALFDKLLAAAEALIAALPYEGSVLLAKGWMNYKNSHTPNLIDYIAVLREAKAAPIPKVLPGLSPQQLQALFLDGVISQMRSGTDLFRQSNRFGSLFVINQP